MKTNYLPGKYKLTKITDESPPYEDDTFIHLTSAEAKMMFKKYDDLGFDRIEYCDSVNE